MADEAVAAEEDVEEQGEAAHLEMRQRELCMEHQ